MSGMGFMPSQYEESPTAPNVGAFGLGTFAEADSKIVAHESQQVVGGLFSLPKTAAALTYGATVDTVDSILSSITPMDRGTISGGIARATGMPGINQWYQEYQGTMEVGSGIATILASGGLAGATLKSGSFVMKAASKLPYGAKIAALDSKYYRALETLREADLRTAQMGIISQEAAAANIANETLWGGLGAVTRNEAKKGFMRAAVTRGAATNVLTEANIAVLGNQNDFLFADETSLGMNLAFAGLGLGLGGLVDVAQARFAIKKLVVSDTTNRAVAHALDPQGTEQARIVSALAAIPENATNPNLATIHWDNGRFSDEAVSYMVSAREATNVDNTPSGLGDLFSRKESLATKQRSAAESSINKVTTQGFPFVPGSNFSTGDTLTGRQVSHAMRIDPAAMYGVGALGALPRGMNLEDFQKAYQGKLDAQISELTADLSRGGKMVDSTRVNPKTGQREKVKILRQFNERELKATREAYRHLVFQNSSDMFAFVDGEKVSLATARKLEKVQFDSVIKENATDEYSVWTSAGREAGDNIGIDSNLSLYLPKNQGILELDLNDSLALFRVADKVIDSFAASAKATGKRRFVVPEKFNWLHLDMAEEFIRRTDRPDLVQFPKGMIREDAMAESFKLKAKDLRHWADALSTDDLMDMRWRLNLPRLTAYEKSIFQTSEHPAEIMLRSLGKDEGKDLGYHQIRQGIAQSRSIGAMGLNNATESKADEFMGNMFKFNMDNKGNPMDMVIGRSRPLAPFQWTKPDLDSRLALDRTQFAKDLAGKEAPEFSQKIMNQLLSDPQTQIASNVNTLREIQRESSVPFFRASGTGGDFVTKEWRDRMQPVMQAATKVNDVVNRLARAMTTEILDRNLSRVLPVINSPGNQASRVLANRFLSYRSGWDFAVKKKSVVTGMDAKGFTTFRLDPKSEHNLARWRQQFGEEMPADAVAMGPDGKPLAVDSTGLGFLQSIQKLSDEVLANKNSLRKAKGLPPLQSVPMFSPPPSIRGKYVGFTFDAHNKVVRGGTIIAETTNEFERQLKILNEGLLKDPRGYVFRKQEDIEDFDSIWDEAQMDFRDPLHTATQGQTRAKGNLVGPEVNLRAIEDYVEWARDSLLTHGNQIKDEFMAPVIKAARMRAEISAPRKKSLISRAAQREENTIFDDYVSNLKGTAQVNTQGSIVGKITKPLEDKIDSILDQRIPEGQAKSANVWNAATLWMSKFNPAKPATSKQAALFTKLQSRLGEYMPFKDVSEMIERQYGVKRPPNLKELMGKTSEFEAFMRLRFDFLHPALNLLGLVAASPAVIRSMQPAVGESAEDFALRIGQVGSVIPAQNGPIGVLNASKLMASAWKDGWNRKNLSNYDRWQSRGYITQEVAEFHRQMSVLDSREGWQATMFGDPKSTNVWRRQGVTGTVANLSDRSEDFTRATAHIAGYRLGQHLGIEDIDALDSYAHHFANQTIANYDPLNRPAVFQTPLGAPFGLFQSFAINYYQRLFSYIESGQTRNVAVQMATQAFAFGTHTVPGFDQLNALVMKSREGNEDLDSDLHDRFDAETSDVLFGGVFGNLPKLVGLPAVDFSTRGDANFRVPLVQAPPIMDTLARASKAIKDGWASGIQGELSPQRAAEILSNTLTNRPMAGMIETWGADGYDTDGFGQLVSEANGVTESAIRVIGGKSLRMAKEAEAEMNHRQAREMDQIKLENLREDFRAERRRVGRDDTVAVEDLNDYFSRYIQAGGDPKRWSQWVRMNSKSALTPRIQREINRLEKSARDPALLDRLMDMSLDVDEDLEENPFRIAEQESYGDEALIRGDSGSTQEATDAAMLPE